MKIYGGFSSNRHVSWPTRYCITAGQIPNEQTGTCIGNFLSCCRNGALQGITRPAKKSAREEPGYFWAFLACNPLRIPWVIHCWGYTKNCVFEFGDDSLIGSFCGENLVDFFVSGSSEGWNEPNYIESFGMLPTNNQPTIVNMKDMFGADYFQVGKWKFW